MILFDNSLVQLMEYRNRENKQNYNKKRPNTGAAKIGMGHVCLWAQNDIVPLQQMNQILQAEKDGNYPYPGFVSAKTVANEEERNRMEISEQYNDFGNGFRLMATRGPVGEKIEIAYRIADGNDRTLLNYCDNKGVSTLMLRPLVDSDIKTKVSQKMAGFHHVSMTVKNREDTKRFYINVLGGNLTTERGSTAGSEAFYNIFFQDDILEAQNQGRYINPKFGIIPNLNIEYSGVTVDVDFYFFSNFYFETYIFNDNSVGTETLMAPEYQSPAYHRSFVTGFQVNDTIDFNAYIKKVENDASSIGLSQVKANRPIAVNTLGDSTIANSDYSAPMTAGDLEGFNYVYLKGPSGEQLAFTQFKGAAKAALKEALLMYGGVSKAFRETDPWNYGGFTEYCQRLHQCDCNGCC